MKTKQTHRILSHPIAREALLDVVDEVGRYAWRFANTPVDTWLAEQDHVEMEDEWFYPGVDEEVLIRLRN
ncbi:MAG: hypothetical protein JJ896_02760 [Rhodothermales bacterium]|nr:hypothetical protein [Rhodothermales bacterium]MBO6778552.1 hypothetical protein [Rhodothermales bacterium]